MLDLIYLLFMAFLLVLSAFFSLSETAFFSLPLESVNLMARSASPEKKRVAQLLEKPRRLLLIILFGNMTVNTLFYAISCVLAVRVGKSAGTAAAVAISAGSLLTVIILGEITPKTIAVNRAEWIAPIVSKPVAVICAFLGPMVASINQRLTRFIDWATAGRTESPLELGELKLLVGEMRSTGLIDHKVTALIEEVIDISAIKIREVMTARVNLVMFEIDAGRDEFLRLARENKKQTLPVYRQDRDHVIGMLDLKAVLAHPDRPLEELIERVPFAPESQTIEQLLEELRKTGGRFALVVDEYGGFEGVVSLEDVVEEIVGEIYDEYDVPSEPVREVGEGEYLLAGNLSAREWSEIFRADLEETGISTLAGYVVKLLGHIPKGGETVARDQLLFTVEEMEGHRIKTVRVKYLKEPARDAVA